MRLVVFGGSIDDSSVGEPCGLSIQLIQAALTAHLGKRVEARYVRAFPAANLPQRVGRTVEALDPDAVIRYGEAIRFLAGRESTPVLVRGPMSLGSYLNYPKHQQAMEARIRQTDAELATLCSRYRVPYYSMVKLTAPDPLRYLGDDL